MIAPKEVAQANFSIYRGLPFTQMFRYETATGTKVDLTGKKAELTLRATVDSLDILYTFSTANGKIVLGNGSILIQGLSEVESAAFDWNQAVGHLIIEEIVGRPAPIALFLFNVRNPTSGVPL